MGEKPVLGGWTYSVSARSSDAHTEAFRKRALEDLYIAIDPGHAVARSLSKFDKEDRQRLTELVDQLAIALVGGVPEGFESYC